MANEIDVNASIPEDIEVQVQVDVQDSVSVKDAEAWAVGKRNGVDVGSSDPTYHNNSKYYAQQAAGSATDANTAKGDAVSAKNAAVAAKTAAETAQGKAETAITHYPKVESGTWWVWDVTNSQWVNTNVKATGEWRIVKTYASIAAMNADYSGTDVKVGEFVMIVSTVEDPDNAKLYVKGSSAYTFVVDMSGATGIQGPAAYVHIKWAAAQPTQDSDMKTVPDAWMGIYSGTSSTAPTHYTDYVWNKVRGETGATGQTGATGATGATPNISIGTVTTGEPGTSAAVTMSGTAENPVLNMTIPRGMPGDNSNVLLFDEHGHLYINVDE